METSRGIKESAIALIKSLPDDISLEDIIETLCFKLSVEEGLADAEAGKFVAQEEIERKFNL